MLDQLAEAAKNGDKDAAMELLDRMQDMLENLRTAEQSRALAIRPRRNRRTMRDIDNLMREQQKLRDDTFSHERGNAKGADQQPGDDEAQDGQGESQQDRAAQSPGAGKGKRQGQRGGDA